MTTATKPLPAHGERPRYLRGCRCLPCREANKRYCKQYRVKTVRQPIRVDATPARDRVQEWADRGYSHAQIAAVLGKHSGDISKLLQGQPTIAPAAADRILRSPGPAGIPAHAQTDSTGMLRRARALHAIGYPLYVIAAGVPMATNHLGRILDREPAAVSVAVAQGMAALYEQLKWRPGPSHYAVHSARRRGFHGPFAWDGNIDNPAAKPDVSAPYKPAGPRRRDAFRKAEIEHLHQCGESVASIAKKVGKTEKYVGDQLAVIIRDLQAGQTRDRKPVAA
jgi:hypothetical protein